MNKKKITGVLIVMILLLTIVGSAAAQAGTPDPDQIPTVDPSITATPTPEPVVPNFGHPVVTLLDKYFGDGILPPTPMPGDESGLSSVGEQIAVYHADGMGFGALVKLYAMAGAAQQTCATDPASPACQVNVNSLVTEFNAGAGMGSLMKTYGRPAVMGVGQVRKAVNEQENSGTDQGMSDNDGMGKGKGNGKSNGKGK